MRITEQLINKIEKLSGGFTKETLRKLTVSWPPRKGWRQRILGKEIPDDSFIFSKPIEHNFFG